MKKTISVLVGFLFSASVVTGCATPAGTQRGSVTPREQAKADRKEAVERARASFERAKAAGAEDRSPFEYYAAEEYLEMAAVESKEGDSAATREFAAKSENYSAEALARSGRGAK